MSVPPEASILVHLTKYLIFSLPGEPFVIVEFLLTIHYCSPQYEACPAYSSYGAIQQLQILSISGPEVYEIIRNDAIILWMKLKVTSHLAYAPYMELKTKPQHIAEVIRQYGLVSEIL